MPAYRVRIAYRNAPEWTMDVEARNPSEAIAGASLATTDLRARLVLMNRTSVGPSVYVDPYPGTVEDRHETVRLFEPAPTQLPGQLGLGSDHA